MEWFYTRLEGDKEVDDFEHWFDRKFEAPAKPIFKKLLSEQRISREESIVLSHYVFAQYVRTPAAYLRLTEQSLRIFPQALQETVLKLNKVAADIQRGGSVPQVSDTIENNLLPMKVVLDKENSMVEVKTIIGRGSYLHDLKHLAILNYKNSWGSWLASSSCIRGYLFSNFRWSCDLSELQEWRWLWFQRRLGSKEL